MSKQSRGITKREQVALQAELQAEMHPKPHLADWSAEEIHDWVMQPEVYPSFARRGSE